MLDSQMTHTKYGWTFCRKPEYLGKVRWVARSEKETDGDTGKTKWIRELTVHVPNETATALGTDALDVNVSCFSKGPRGGYSAGSASIETNVIDHLRHLARVDAACSVFRNLENSMQEHFRVANQYEEGGNTEGCRYLRYVGNLLATLLEGKPGTTILPSNEEVAKRGNS